MPRNVTMIFYGPEERQWALVAPRGSPEEGTTHQGAPGPQALPGGLCPPRGTPQAQPGPITFLLVQKNLHKVSLRLDSI